MDLGILHIDIPGFIDTLKGVKIVGLNAYALIGIIGLCFYGSNYQFNRGAESKQQTIQAMQQTIDMLQNMYKDARAEKITLEFKRQLE